MRFVRSESYFPLIIGLHFVLWAVDLWAYEGVVDPQQVAGEAFSSWVVTVFAFNFLMATRAHWVERIFGGLDKMYLIHRRSGVIAVALLLLHFIAIPKSSGFAPGKPLGVVALVLILIGAVVAAVPPLKRRIPYGRWLPSHRWMGLFYAIGIAHAVLVESLMSELVLVRTYVFGMAVVGLGAWIYRVFLYRRLHPPIPHRVVDVCRPSSDVVIAELQPDSDPLAFTRGQFAFFSFEGLSGRESHPFTISGTSDDGRIRLSVKVAGDLTRRLHRDLEVGTSVAVDGPFGHFTQAHTTSDEQVWVAGGIGITPFLSMAADLPEGRRVTLFWSVKNEGEAFARAELEGVAARNDDFELVVWPSDLRGHLTAEDLARGRDLSHAEVLICGPEAMKDALRAGLSATGLAQRQIHDEFFRFR